MRIRCGFIGWPNPYEKLPTSSVSELEKVRTIIVVGHSGFRRSRHRRRRLHRAVGQDASLFDRVEIFHFGRSRWRYATGPIHAAPQASGGSRRGSAFIEARTRGK